MITKAQVSYIRSLARQKVRVEEKAFVAEGDKIAREWLNSSSTIIMIAALQSWLDANAPVAASHPEALVIPVTESELERISGLSTPNNVVLVVRLPVQAEDEPVPDEWCLALDDIQDPGNMGTLIRIADWFGIRRIFASHNCADAYGPKVVQSAMGGQLRVQVHPCSLVEKLATAGVPLLAATLNGTSIHDCESQAAGVILIGNEGRGLSDDLIKMATSRITIPRLGEAESLNAAVSAGILCSHLIRG